MACEQAASTLLELFDDFFSEATDRFRFLFEGIRIATVEQPGNRDQFRDSESRHGSIAFEIGDIAISPSSSSRPWISEAHPSQIIAARRSAGSDTPPP